MAKVKLNPAIAGISGQLGNVVFKQYGDRQILTQKGVATGPRSAKQLAGQERFRQAAKYSKAALADPAKRAIYEAVAAKDRQRLFSVGVKDFMHPPEISKIDLTDFQGRPGDRIVVQAEDDVVVTDVAVVVADEAGRVLAEGAAVETSVGWVFTLENALGTGDVVVTAVARDLAGNEGMFVL